MELKRAKVIVLPEENGIVINTRFEPQGRGHLYFITDDEIKEGDWIYYIESDNSENWYIIRVEENKDEKWKSYGRKIVATTDPSLNKYPLSTKDKKFKHFISLPQPSQAFIEKYCKVGGIDEVMIEMELFITDRKDESSDLDINLNDYKIKVDSHNTITIHPIKDSWSRDEVTELITNAVAESHDWSRENDDIHSIGIIKGRFLNNWIKQNL